MNQNPSKVDRAVTHIITHHPFYASILLKRKLVANPNIKTAQVTATGRISYNPHWFESMSVLQIVFVLCHECMHYMFMHASRRGPREFRRWIWAADAVINSLLIHTNVGEPPEKGVFVDGAWQHNAEYMYGQFPEQEPPQQPPPTGGTPCDDGEPDDGGSGGEEPSDDGEDDGGSGGNAPDDNPDGGEDTGEGSGSSGDQGDPDGASQDHQPDDLLGDIGEDIDESEQLEEGESAQQEAEIKIELAQARNAAKQMGKLPAALEQLIEELLTVKTPWYEYLERFMTRSNTNDYSWEVGDRRYLGANIFLPTLHSLGMGELAVICDESGSVSRDERAEFGGHFNKLLDSCQPEKVYLLHVDTRVHEPVEEFEAQDYPVKFRTIACGGTDMSVGIDYVKKHLPDVDCIIVLTDGWTPWGDDPGIPTFWAITDESIVNNQPPTFGEAVHITVGEDR